VNSPYKRKCRTNSGGPLKLIQYSEIEDHHDVIDNCFFVCRENIEGLALALAEIASRQAQHRNFQLVVITHDEEFIELLSRSDRLQYYQKVSRNARGLSEIRKMGVSTLEQ
jgi:hypothetical protein